MPFNKLNLPSYNTMLDWLIPKNILDQDYEIDYLARRNLLQARAVVTVLVSALVALMIQFILDFCFLFEHTQNVMLPYGAWPFSLIGTLIYTAILYFIPSGRITISQAAKVGIYCFLVYASCIGNGIQELSHANFFVVAPFGYIFVNKDFGRQTTILICIIYTVAFFRSIGRQINPISLSSSGRVLCDVYIFCFVFFLFAAYEQEFQSNQEQMQKSLDEARSAATAKSMFISNVSHELRTPLHGILATVEILAKTPLNESQRTLLNAIESCGTNLISVVNQVLTYARVEHGKLELERNVFDIYTVMQEIGDGLAPIPERKNLDFFVCVECDPLQRFFVGDVGVLRQIILNLLGNAIKFTEQGRIEFNTTQITVENEEDGQGQLKQEKTSKESETIKSPSSVQGPKTIFRIEVTDTGHGIAPDFISHMYQPFSQEDSSLRRKFEGTGLGLSIVKGLLDMMHSQLEVDSKLGQGSKFSFRLELPNSDRLDDMYASPLPFDFTYLKLPRSEQVTLIKRLRSLSYVVLNVDEFLLSNKIAHYLEQWGFSYRLISRDKLQSECTEQHSDIVILDDNVDYLECFLNGFTKYYLRPEKTVGKKFAKEEQIEVTEEKQQRVLFFSTIENHQKVEALLMKYRPQSAIVVTKPAGPVKILSAIIKAMESLFRKPSLGDKAQERKKVLIKEEYIDFIKNSNINKFGTMDIGPSGELTISPSRLTPPEMLESILSGTSNMQIEAKDKKAETDPVIEKKKKALKNISFLIVEDNKINAMILTTMLKQSGYHNYDIANNGLEAVQHFTRKSYDIIFMDLQMPICDGIVATKEIRKIERGEQSHLLSPPSPDSPTEEVGEVRKRQRKKAIIVAMTGLASNEDSQVAEAAGCNEFLTKPISIKSLNARMENWTKEVLKVEEAISSVEEENNYEETEENIKELS